MYMCSHPFRIMSHSCLRLCLKPIETSCKKLRRLLHSPPTRLLTPPPRLLYSKRFGVFWIDLSLLIGLLNGFLIFDWLSCKPCILIAMQTMKYFFTSAFLFQYVNRFLPTNWLSVVVIGGVLESIQCQPHVYLHTGALLQIPKRRHDRVRLCWKLSLW